MRYFTRVNILLVLFVGHLILARVLLTDTSEKSEFYSYSDRMDKLDAAYWKLTNQNKHIEANSIARQMLQLAYEQRKYNPIKATMVHVLLGWNCQWLGRLDQAEKYFHLAVLRAEADSGAESLDLYLPLKELGVVFYQTSQFSEAEAAYLRVLNILKLHEKENDKDMVEILHKLAQIYSDWGKLEAAEPYLEEALPLCERVCDRKDEIFAIVVHDFALFRHRQQKSAEAEKLYIRALALDEEFRPNSWETGSAHTNLSRLYLEMGQFPKAEVHARQALSIMEQLYKPGHPQIAYILMVFGRINAIQRRYEPALEYFRRALDIYEHYPSPHLNELKDCLDMLARVYLDQDLVEDAEPLIRRLEQVLGDTRDSNDEMLYNLKHNLANAYSRLKSTAKAEAQYRQVLEGWRQKHGEDLHVALVLENLGVLKRNQGDLNGAEGEFQKALELREKFPGDDERGMAGLCDSIARFHAAAGHWAQAQEFWDRALMLREKVLPSSDPVLGETLEYLGDMFAQVGKFPEAEALYQRATKILQNALGPTSLEAIGIYDRLARLYDNMLQSQRAEEFYLRALEAIQLHPEADKGLVFQLHLNLGILYGRMQKFSKAEPLLMKSLETIDRAPTCDMSSLQRAIAGLTLMYEKQSRYAKEVELFLRYLPTFEKELGPEHKHTDELLVSLIQAYENAEQYAKALPYAERLLALREKVRGPDADKTRWAIKFLAYLYRMAGFDEKAEMLEQRYPLEKKEPHSQQDSGLRIPSISP